ncbi:MAG: RHS repeat-associated core domain-containing protein [Planctomycetota bacterium]
MQASGGRETQYLYDDHNSLYRERSKVNGSTWAVEERGYHADGVLARAIEPTGLVGTVDTLDAWGRPQRIHLPSDKHVYFVRDDENRMIQSEYRTGVGATLQQTLATSVDDLGRVLNETLSAPGTTMTRTVAYTHNGPFRIATEIDGDGRGASYGYDHRGRLVRKQDRLLGTTGNAEVFARDVVGNVTRVDHVEQRQTGASSYSPATYRIDLTYDAWDRLVRGDFFGSVATVQFTRFHGYDSLDNSTWFKDGVGKETRRAFDAAGRRVDEWLHQRNPALPAVHLGLAYDDAPTDPLLSAIVTRTDGVGNVSKYHYDLLGRLGERQLPGYVAGNTAKQWQYQYDLASRLIEWRDGNGTRVQQLYDSQKRLVERKVIQLPTNGVVLSVMATHETWAHDDFDRVVSAQTWWSTYPHFSASQPPSLVEAVDGYDSIGRQVLERFRYLDDPNPGYVPMATKDLVYGFAKAGGGEDGLFRRSVMTSAGFTIGTTPDGAGKLASMALNGPGIAQQPLGDWRYEGNRPIWRRFLPGASLTTELVTEYSYNAVRHMTQMTTTRFVSGANTGLLYDLVMERDAEGNITQHRYSKASGKAGDWFQLDGWDRLQEAKLGVTSFAGTYSGATTYDKKLTYALDEAHNRTQVDEEVGGSVASSVYQRNGATNEYASVTQPNGDVQSWLYDGNGNVLSDGFYLYVYDHLDRLSEAYVLTYPGGATDQTATGTTVQVYSVAVQKRRQGKKTVLPSPQWRDRVLQARGRLQNSRSAAGTSSSDPRIPFGANVGTTGTAAAAVDEPVPVIVAYYGYDPSNRRIGKLFPDFSGAIYAWSGWEMVEAYDLVFTPTTVWFEGAVVDDHFGYAWRNPATGTWTRYGYVLDHTRGIVKVVDTAGQLVEQYQYDPYGRMTAYDALGSLTGQVPTVPGQVYGFGGGQRDTETGLHYFRNRYYDASHGRFLTNDPVGAWRDQLASGNGYAYCGSQPACFVDPQGLYTTVVVIVTGDAELDARNQKIATERASRDPDGGRVVTVGGDGEGGSRGSGYHSTSRPVPPKRTKPPGKPVGKLNKEWRKYFRDVAMDGAEIWEGRHRVIVLYGHATQFGDSVPLNDDGTVKKAVEEPPPNPPRGPEPTHVFVETCRLGRADADPDPKANTARYLREVLPKDKFKVWGFDCWISPQGDHVAEVEDDQKTPKRDASGAPVTARPVPVGGN